MIKAIKTITAIEGIISLSENIGREPEFRKDVYNDVIGDITIDTAKAFDTRMWETGIERKSIEGEWIIVEQYKSKEEAEKKHKKWVELMKSTPKMELEDINLWNL